MGLGGLTQLLRANLLPLGPASEAQSWLLPGLILQTEDFSLFPSASVSLSMKSGTAVPAARALRFCSGSSLLCDPGLGKALIEALQHVGEGWAGEAPALVRVGARQLGPVRATAHGSLWSLATPKTERSVSRLWMESRHPEGARRGHS